MMSEFASDLCGKFQSYPKPPLQDVFGNTTRIEILSVFLNNPDEKYNITAISEKASVSRTSVYMHLANTTNSNNPDTPTFMDLGLVQKSPNTGRTTRYTLDTDAPLTRVLLKLVE